VGAAAGVVVVAVAVWSVVPVKPVADVFACTDGDAAKPVEVFPFVASGAAVATSSAVVGSVGASCDLAAVPSVAWPAILLAVAPTVIASDAIAPAPFAVRGGGAKAAAADELAAMAAAAIASGALELAAGVGAAFAVAGCGATGMAVATAMTVVAGVAVASACVASVAGVESAEVLSADLASPGFVLVDFAPFAGAPLDFPTGGLVGAGCPESAGESFEALDRVV